jgi:hypothetical protein
MLEPNADAVEMGIGKEEGRVIVKANTGGILGKVSGEVPELHKGPKH